MRKESKKKCVDICVRVTGLLCCTPETNTTLLSQLTRTKNLKNKQKTYLGPVLSPRKGEVYIELPSSWFLASPPPPTLLFSKVSTRTSILNRIVKHNRSETFGGCVCVYEREREMVGWEWCWKLTEV